MDDTTFSLLQTQEIKTQNSSSTRFAEVFWWYDRGNEQEKKKKIYRKLDKNTNEYSEELSQRDQPPKKHQTLNHLKNKN